MLLEAAWTYHNTTWLHNPEEFYLNYVLFIYKSSTRLTVLLDGKV